MTFEAREVSLEGILQQRVGQPFAATPAALHRPRDKQSHADHSTVWLSRDKFDPVLEEGGWIFARKQDVYLALRSQQPYFWNEGCQPHQLKLRNSEEDIRREVIAPGGQNIWVCQLGRETQDRTFEPFIQSIRLAEVKFDGLQVNVREITETTALGAAFLALVGIGVYTSLMEAYERYRPTYFALLPVFEEAAERMGE